MQLFDEADRRESLKKTVIVLFMAVNLISIILVFHSYPHGENPVAYLCESAVEALVITQNNSSYVEIPQACIEHETNKWAEGADNNDLVGYFPNSSNEYRLKKVE
mgnify:CR=1 FL=1